MISNYQSDDDLGPQERALSQHLRERAKAQGCVCVPVVNHDPSKEIVVIEHHPDCPAWRHPSANASAN